MIDCRSWLGEERLMQLNQPSQSLPPKPATWEAIEEAIAPQTAPKEGRPAWLLSWGWAFGGALATLLVMALWPSLQTDVEPGPSTDVVTTNAAVDYVAVLVSDDGQPALTALGEAQTQTLSLHWEAESPAPDTSYQIWAVSKRDGERRSIAVLTDTTPQLVLGDAHWRLVTDAHSLLMTLEESGGSAIDEPSDNLLASGLCVRIQRSDETT